MSYACHARMISVLVAIAAFAAAVFVSAPSRTVMAAGPTFKVEPQSTVVDEGEQFKVTITLEGAPGISSFEFNLDFDPRIVEYVAAAKGPFLGSTGRAATCVPLLSDDKDTLRYGCVTLGGSGTLPSGGGTLADITFRAKDAGSSQLRLSYAQITAGYGIETPEAGGLSGCANPGGYCDTVSGSVTVAGEDPLPTATVSDPSRPNEPGASNGGGAQPEPSVNPNAPGGANDAPGGGSGSGNQATGSGRTGTTRPGGEGADVGSSGGRSPSGFASAGYGPQAQSQPWWQDLSFALSVAAAGGLLLAFGIGARTMRRSRTAK